MTRSERIAQVCDQIKNGLISTIEQTGAQTVQRPFLVPGVTHGEALLTIASSYLRQINAINSGRAAETDENNVKTLLRSTVEAFVLYLADADEPQDFIDLKGDNR